MYICVVAAFPLWESCHLGNCYFGKCTFGKLLLGKLHIWKVATWENTLGKLPLGKRPLGKCLTSFLTWRISISFRILNRIWLKIFISRTNVLILTLALFAKELKILQPIKPIFNFFNITNKSIIFISKSFQFILEKY